MKIAFSWDDGSREDLRLFDLHNKYNIPGMFFVPNKNVERKDVLTPNDIGNNESELICFGGHTENHVYLTSIHINTVKAEVENNKQYLEDILGHRVDDFCFPGGKYNRQILNMVLESYKTVRTADTMFFGEVESNIVRPSFHFYPRGYKSLMGNAVRHMDIPEFMYLFEKHNGNYFDLIKSLIEFESMLTDRNIMVWGHSWEIAECSLWDELESFFGYIHDNYRDNCVSYKEFVRGND